MSKATKRKYVTREVLDDYTLPEEHQQIVKVVASRGNNLHEIQTAMGDQFLVSMPTRFRKNIWIKRGDFVIVDPILEGDKVKGEIATILYPKQIKYIQKEGLWPVQFTSKASGVDAEKGHQNGDKDDRDKDSPAKDLSELSLDDNGVSQLEAKDEESDSGEDNDDDLFVNTNRPSGTYYYSESDEDCDDEDGDDEDGER